MPIQCWTLIHRVTEPIRHAAPIRHLVRRVAHVLHPARAVVLHPRTWVETACRLLPAITVGSTLLIPHSVGPTPVHPASPPVADAPPLTIFAPPDIGFSLPPTPIALPDPGFVWPTGPPGFVPRQPPAGFTPKHSAAEVPAPASMPIILTGLGGLAFVRAIGHWRRRQRRDDRQGSLSVDDPDTASSGGQA
jgi:hypothetical protein